MAYQSFLQETYNFLSIEEFTTQCLLYPATRRENYTVVVFLFISIILFVRTGKVYAEA